MRKLFNISKQILFEEYVSNKKSITQIADLYNFNYVSIYNWLKKYNIKIRTKRETHLGKKRPDQSIRMTGINNPMFGKKRPLSVRRKISKGRIGKYSGKNHPMFGIKRPEWSKLMKQSWKNKLFREQRVKSFLTKNTLNKAEKYLNHLFNKLNLKYIFVGNGKLILDGLCPDFVDTKNKKIIELYGEYWHRPNKRIQDKRRISIYKKYGYKTLIIWYNELKNLDRLINKIVTF